MRMRWIFIPGKEKERAIPSRLGDRLDADTSLCKQIAPYALPHKPVPKKPNWQVTKEWRGTQGTCRLI